MRLLLDTHALIWALVEPQRLSSRAAGLISDPANTVLVSAVSAWEIATKYRIGKLPSAGPVIDAYEAYMATLRAEELPVRAAHALRAGALVMAHRDPFDRMLAAQAMVEGVPLLTNDHVFAALTNLETWW